MGKIYAGAIGVEIIIDLQQDISAATTYSIIVRKDGEESTWDSAVYESNYLRYVTEDALEEGTYYLHPSLVLGGWTGYGKWVSFVVHKKWG